VILPSGAGVLHNSTKSHLNRTVHQGFADNQNMTPRMRHAYILVGINLKTAMEPLKNYLTRPGGVEFGKKMLIYCV
ncbi:MAG TPA: hypothetical protein PKD17_14725, partial [Cellvibrionaceae bacterium]|nr:hypothetical protein [Cellvibrionaceae bacterium]